jgi:hypothetical protein
MKISIATIQHKVLIKQNEFELCNRGNLQLESLDGQL